MTSVNCNDWCLSNASHGGRVLNWRVWFQGLHNAAALLLQCVFSTLQHCREHLGQCPKHVHYQSCWYISLLLRCLPQPAGRLQHGVCPQNTQGSTFAIPNTSLC